MRGVHDERHSARVCLDGSREVLEWYVRRGCGVGSRAALCTAHTLTTGEGAARPHHACLPRTPRQQRVRGGPPFVFGAVVCRSPGSRACVLCHVGVSSRTSCFTIARRSASARAMISCLKRCTDGAVVSPCFYPDGAYLPRLCDAAACHLDTAGSTYQ